MFRSRQDWISAAEYLLLEAESEEKHEYLDGQLYLMAGATANHISIAMNLVAAIRPHLRGRNCRLYSSELRVRPDEGSYFYPDLVVVCGVLPAGDDIATTAPTLVIEILSPSTRGVDRGIKFRRYRNASTLLEYVLIDSTVQAADVHRLEGGEWIPRSYAPPDPLLLASIGLSLSFQTIYEDVG